VWCDFDTFNSLLDELGGDFGLGLAYVCLAEEELAVEVGDVDCIHVDDVDVFESRQGEVLEDFAA